LKSRVFEDYRPLEIDVVYSGINLLTFLCNILLKASYTLKIEVLCFYEMFVAFCKISLRLDEGDALSHRFAKFESPNLFFVSLEHNFTPLVTVTWTTYRDGNKRPCLYSACSHHSLSFTWLCLSSPCSFWYSFCNKNRIFFVGLFGKLI
jgi:hypothetical protein